MNDTRAPLIALTLFIAGSALGQGDPATVARIIEEGRDRSQAMSTLVEMTEGIGPRATGTPQLRKAEDWAVTKFEAWGLQTVHLEKWGETPMGFERGPRQSARMVAPFEKQFVFTTNCWTVGTDRPVRGWAVLMPENLEQFRALRGRLNGAWVLMPDEVSMGGARLTDPTDLDRAMDAAGIAGRVYTTGQDLVWTHGRWTQYTDATRPKKPLITIRGEDFNTVTRALEGTSNVVLEFDIENIFLPGPMPLHNVIAEIRGTEKPDEVVIISGHFDSWNGPGSQGASDNGTGSTVTMEAARILAAVGARPKRTIRFILWTGEEQGLLGSAAYVEAHKAELYKISCVLNEDSGPNYHASISGTPDMMQILTEAVKPMADAFPGKPVVAKERERLGGGGSDHASFLKMGVPGFTFGKAGGFNYRRVWHTQYDRHTEVPEGHLAQMATNMAVVAFNIACADELLPRVPVRNGPSAGVESGSAARSNR
ncbi:MAG: M20/M25/M40 family metallo-hydrolase [Armatimonadetes bacterium]|nr:M20/M25/M40 family metallo-hydrolase [Armatimonadota bacterium]